MRVKTAVIFLLIVSVVLGALLLYRHSLAAKEKKESQASILQLSNDLVQTSTRLSEQQKVNISLETNLALRGSQLLNFSNQLLHISTTLTQVQTEAKEAAELAQAEMAKRDAKIDELESERDSLTRRMADLNVSITDLESKISETEKKLASSEENREFLLQELKRLQAEKAELERQFNDLAILREQVRKLRDELSIARRLDWIRRGLYGQLKGAERLQRGFPPAGPETNYNLEVEIRQSGEAKILTPEPKPPIVKDPTGPK